MSWIGRCCVAAVAAGSALGVGAAAAPAQAVAAVEFRIDPVTGPPGTDIIAIDVEGCAAPVGSMRLERDGTFIAAGPKPAQLLVTVPEGVVPGPASVVVECGDRTGVHAFEVTTAPGPTTTTPTSTTTTTTAPPAPPSTATSSTTAPRPVTPQASKVGPAPSPQPGKAGGIVPPSAADIVPGRYIVRLRDTVDAASFARTLPTVGIASVGGPHVWSDAIEGFVASLSAQQRDQLTHDPRVVSIHPDTVIRADVRQPTGRVWGLDRVDRRCTGPCASRLNGSYAYSSSGSGVTAYVIDTGVARGHSQFLRSNGTTRVLSSLNFTGDGRNFDCNGHGTHVAGTIGGKTYGVAKNVSIRPIKVLTCDGTGYSSDAITAIDYLVAAHGSGRAVANMSLGGSYNSAMNAAVDRLIADGVSVVVASGNRAANACAASPASVYWAVTVNAADANDVDASWSNGGSCTDLHAPGVSVLSAWPTSGTATRVLSGTSMASPHVAGCIARRLERGPVSPHVMHSALLSQSSHGVMNFASGSFSNTTPNRLLYCPLTW